MSATPHQPISDASDANPDSPRFLVIDCPECKKYVLTATDLDENGEFIDVCMHCESVLSADSPSARWVHAQTVLELGYFVDGIELDSGEEKESGCRGGSCGIRQPDNSVHG